MYSQAKISHHVLRLGELFLSFVLFIMGILPMYAQSVTTCGDESMVAGTQRQIIILKGDDILPSPTWERFTNYIEAHNLKASLGLVCENLYDDNLSSWLKSLQRKDNFEIWNHGFAHFCIDGDNPGEFNGNAYESQLYYLQESQRVYKEKLGTTCHVFGTPCNQKDNNTTRAVVDIPELNIWLYGRTDSDKLFIDRIGNIEIPTGFPNYPDFVSQYTEKNLAQYNVLVLQLHPGWWKDENWVNFEKIVAFLLERNAVFMTPSEYYHTITETITVTTTANDGAGSLRDAIRKANSNLEQDAIILLPAGIYSLSGPANENNNLGGDLDIMSNMIIRGAGSGSTIIDGNGNDRIFHILDGRVSLTDLTIRNGKATCGGGICVEDGHATITHCTIKENTATGIGGAGIYGQNASITLSHCNIINNTGNSTKLLKGGGVFFNIKNERFVDIRYCLISGNSANNNSSGRGGGVYIYGPMLHYEASIFNNTFINNKAAVSSDGEGGGLYIEQAKALWLDRNRFDGNIASKTNNGKGGALAVEGLSTLTISANLLVTNCAAWAGSGCYFDNTTHSGKIKVTMDNNTLANNLSLKSKAPGEAIFVGKDVSISLTNNLLAGHSKGIVAGTNGVNTLTADNNLLYNTTDAIMGEHAILSDPLLDTQYKPTANSPAIDAGKETATVEKDLAGTVLPLGNGYDIGCYEGTPTSESPGFTLDQSVLEFYQRGTDYIDSRTIQLTKTGEGTLNWEVELNRSWLKASSVSGRDSAAITISTNFNELTLGLSTGTVIIRDRNNPANRQVVNINSHVYMQGISASPFGNMDTPLHETTGVSGSVAVTGWALDDTQIVRLEICYEPTPGASLQYIGDAVFVEGARPDVAQHYPTYPNNTRAGWGYMLLTNMLPGGGNGVYPLYARITDVEGNVVVIGPHTITVDNLHATKPFGAIDTPTQGATIYGNQYTNFGWALTPRPNHIKNDGSGLAVWVDSVKMGTPTYNIYREDLATLFPDYVNSMGACGYFTLDTTKYPDGIHTIQWTVADNAGNSDGIGSRYFTINNHAYRSLDQAHSYSEELHLLTPDTLSALYAKHGFHQNESSIELLPDSQGIHHVQLHELEHIELHISKDVSIIAGYLATYGQVTPLPLGSTLDIQSNTFYWTPAPGFIGNYDLVFVVTDKAGQKYKKSVGITITPQQSQSLSF